MMFRKLLLLMTLGLHITQCASSGEEEFEDNFNAFDVDGNFAINNSDFGNFSENINSEGTNEFANFGNFSDQFENDGEWFNNDGFNEFDNASGDNFGFSNDNFNWGNDNNWGNNNFAMNNSAMNNSAGNNFGFDNFGDNFSSNFGGAWDNGVSNPLESEVAVNSAPTMNNMADPFGANTFANATSNTFANAGMMDSPFNSEEVMSNIVEDSPIVDTGMMGGRVSYVMESASILDQPAGQVVGQLERGDHPLIASVMDGFAQMSSGYFVNSSKLMGFLKIKILIYLEC